MISNIDGSLALQKGWHEFSLDHHLEVGQMLVFSYIKDCHFVVQIFGTSASERYNFYCRRGRLKKRSRVGKEKVVEEEPIQTVEKSLIVKPWSSTSVQYVESLQMETIASDSGCDFDRHQFIPEDIIMDDTALMLNKNAGHNPGEDRSHLCDLSSFEIGKNESNADNSKKSLGGEIVLDNSQIRKLTESETNDIQMAENRKYHINGQFDGVLSPAEPAKNAKMIMGSSSLLSNFQNDRKNEVLGCDWLFSSDEKVPSIGCSKLSERQCAAMPTYRSGSFSIPMLKDPSGGRTVSVKEELVEKLHQTSIGKSPNRATDFAQMHLQTVKDSCSIVKSEPGVFVPASPFLAEVKSQAFLELPKILPPVEGKMAGGQGQVVYLRDSARRLWPVLYTATSVIPAFVDGWKRFCEENFIHLGDVCIIKPENSFSGVYRVDVIKQPSC
ncbi:B3 domain-containing Os02g0598200-like [Olea europaea subsp. europaea]|uniref:B3 domain-containing Os02g0598200-like n=1 Tax=Olea europaea subsp. europaea TaxID=158383 RepID=A0A8S0V182_OLEEU|nr:B3 domain-containing Os02g0598200-like [Olea europaea subsp. europaea]